MKNNDFANTLKKARAATGLSQQKMADRMLIPKRTIENWEAGERTPPAYVQRFVLNELEQGKIYLISQDGDEESPQVFGYIKGTEEDAARCCEKLNKDLNLVWHEALWQELDDLGQEEEN